MTDIGWFVIHGDDLKDMLDRAAAGEQPDWLIAEYYANSDHEVIVEDEEDGDS